MGQATSTDFRVETAEWVKTDISLNEDDRWRMIFLTHMEPHEVAMFLPPSELRYLRRFRPANLAKLLFKCIEQLRFAASGAPQFDTEGTFIGQLEHGATSIVASSNDGIVEGEGDDRKKKTKKSTIFSGKPVLDFTSTLNSLRIIGAVLPYLFEELDLTAARQLDTHERLLQRVARGRGEEIKDKEPSPFGANFAQHFLWENKTCEGDDLNTTACFDTSAQGSEQMPFGEELVKLLSRLAFTPGFTVATHQKYLSGKEYSSRAADIGGAPETLLISQWKGLLNVHPELLWFPGMDSPTFFGKQGKIPSSPSHDIRSHRVELMRCLVACLTEPLFNPEGTHGILTHNHVLEVLVDRRKCPLLPTLCVSLFNNIEHFQSKGIMPYSSHYFAGAGEHCVALAMQLLNVVLTPPLAADGTVEKSAIHLGSSDNVQPTVPSAGDGGGIGGRDEEDHVAILTPAEAAATGNGSVPTGAPLFAIQSPSMLNNSGFQLLHSLMGIPGFRDTKVLGVLKSIFKIISNPLYATHQTWMSGSQRVVHCYQEAVILLDRLLVVNSILDVAAEHLSTEMVAPLCYFVQEAKVEYQFFGVTQAATMALMALSSHPKFIKGLQSRTGLTKPVLQALPGLNEGTWGDILLLMVCSTISPSSPRYMSCFYHSYATLLVNILPQMSAVSSTTSFELHHLLDFVTTERFLRRGPGYQQTTRLVVEALTSFMIHQPTASKSFYAVLGVGEVPQRLTLLVEAAAVTAQQEQEESTAGGDGSTAGTRTNTATHRDPLSVDNSTMGGTAIDDAIDGEDDVSDQHQTTTTKNAFKSSWQPLDPLLLPSRHQVSLLESLQRESATAVRATTGKGEAGLKEMASLKLPAELHHQPLQIRKYDLAQDANLRWLQAYLWGMVYRHNVNPPLFDLAKVTTFDHR